MSETFDGLSRDDRLGLLTEDVLAHLDGGRVLDTAVLAARHGLDPEEVRACLAALGALEDAVAAAPEEVDFFFDETRDGGGGRTWTTRPDLPDDYELREEIGRGGMGVVYRAHQGSLDREVAVKVLRPGDLYFGDALARFEKEARHLARLTHPHIVSVHDVGRTDGSVWFTMDLVEGANLADRIKEGWVTLPRTLRIMGQVTSAIAHTHGHGLIHRDLKPQNVLIDDEGGAYVTDFGLARETSSSPELTQTGQVLGTPGYMSPEQARGDQARIGETTDVYALGAILYQCLTGRAPFRGLSPAETLHAVIHTDPVRPRKIDPKIPADLEAICLTALAKAPRQRYATVRAFQEDLERFAERKAVRARRPTRPARALRFLVRHGRVSATVGVVLVLTAVALGAVALLRPGRPWETTLRQARSLQSGGRPAAAAALFARALDGDLPAARRTDVLAAVVESLVAAADADRVAAALDRTVPAGDERRALVASVRAGGIEGARAHALLCLTAPGGETRVTWGADSAAVADAWAAALR